MYIDQCSDGIKLRDIDEYFVTRYFLEKNFYSFFKWNAFEHCFFISDNCIGRHKTIEKISIFIKEPKHLFYIRNEKTNKNYDRDWNSFYSDDFDLDLEMNKKNLENLINKDLEKFKNCIVKEKIIL
jgi:hypothetical protein